MDPMNETGKSDMKETTLCYIERGRQYLMLHRTKKENDENHDKWIGIYRNDCFANLSLTVHALEALRSWIRVIHDGPNYWMWERKWLMDPREVRICLQTHRHCQLPDEELYQQMKRVQMK